MTPKRIAIAIGVAIVIGAAGFAFLSSAPAEGIGPVASALPPTLPKGDLGKAIDNLPPSAVGEQQASLGGTAAKGVVDRVYVRIHEGVLIDLAVAGPDQRDGWRYVSIEFPEPLANGTTAARALVPRGSEDNVAPGDIVEIRFAHKGGTGIGLDFFKTIIERDSVTAVVDKAGSTLAMEYEQRIAARSRAGAGEQVAGPALWKALPLERAVKVVHGTGKREMAVFTDPYCPACVDFERTLQQAEDVTVYVFMFPAIRPDKIEDSKRVWCSPDRAKAWVELVLERKVPEAAPTCDAPLDANLALREPIGLCATPTVVFEDGQRGRGGLLPTELRYELARAERARASTNAR